MGTTANIGIDGGKTTPAAPSTPKEKYECTRDSQCASSQKCSNNKCVPVCQNINCGADKECKQSGSHAYYCQIIDPCLSDPCSKEYPVCTSDGKYYSCSACPRGTANFGDGKCTQSSCTTVPFTQQMTGKYDKFCTEHYVWVRYTQPNDTTLRVEFQDGDGSGYHHFQGTPSTTECRCGYAFNSSSWHSLPQTTHTLPKGAAISSITVSGGSASGCNSWSSRTIYKGSSVELTSCPGYGTQQATVNYSFTANGERIYCPKDQNKNCVNNMCSDQP